MTSKNLKEYKLTKKVTKLNKTKRKKLSVGRPVKIKTSGTNEEKPGKGKFAGEKKTAKAEKIGINPEIPEK